MLTRRSFMLTSGAAFAGVAGRRAMGVASTPLGAVRWHDVTGWGVEGKGWQDTSHFFDRLPARAEGVVPGRVWDLSRQSAGMFTTFETDAREISVRYTLLSDQIAMSHMPATGVSGIDLYGLDGDRWRWAAVFRPAAKTNEGRIAANLDPVTRRWRLYLPLYNGVESLEVGLPEGSVCTPIAPREERPVVFYGTSILHGACASRPGMAWPSIVGRRLDRPTVNLGFSGSGRMERVVAELLAELDAAAYVIDCAPNMNASLIRERAPALVRTIREARPGAPIVLVEDRRYGYGWVRRSSRDHNAANREALRDVFAALQSDGVGGMSYVEADALLGENPEEAMTDGSHPSDLGMTLYADALTPVLRSALG